MAVEQSDQRDAHSEGAPGGTASARELLSNEFASDRSGAASTSDRLSASTSACDADYIGGQIDGRTFLLSTPSRDLKNDNAFEALNQPGERRSEAPLSPEDQRLAADGKRLLKDYMDNMGNMGSNKAGEAFNGLRKLFGQMDAGQQDRVIGAMNDSLTGSPHHIARVPETGEVWLGSQSGRGNKYYLSTMLHRPSC